MIGEARVVSSIILISARLRTNAGGAILAWSRWNCGLRRRNSQAQAVRGNRLA